MDPISIATVLVISILIQVLLRYTDIVNLLPTGTYRLALEYPRLGYTEEGSVSSMINLAYNFYGNLNYKILSYGFIGQLFCIGFKEKFPENTFSLCFSTFFVCSILSSIPNADRLIYHPILISFPYLISFSLDFE